MTESEPERDYWFVTILCRVLGACLFLGWVLAVNLVVDGNDGSWPAAILMLPAALGLFYLGERVRKGAGTKVR